MKIRVQVTSGRVIVKEVQSWRFWGDGIKGFDENEKCILYIPHEHLLAFEEIVENKE